MPAEMRLAGAHESNRASGMEQKELYKPAGRRIDSLRSLAQSEAFGQNNRACIYVKIAIKLKKKDF